MSEENTPSANPSTSPLTFQRLCDAAVTTGEMTRGTVDYFLGLYANSDERAELAAARDDIAAIRAELVSTVAWAIELKIHHGLLKDEARRFIRGVVRAPWKSREPRVIGFEHEFRLFQAQLDVAEPEPTKKEASS